MKTAVIYARYSSDTQTEQSIEGQLRVCNEYAARNQITILDTYIDRAMTGTNDNRPDFQRMIKDSNQKLWDYVIVYKLDRFSRNKYEATIHKHTLANNGTKLLSAMENIPDTPEGIILESLLEGMNQYYSAELAQKVQRGLKESYLKGQFTGGCQIYGYDVVDKRNVINEQEAEIVREVFTRFSQGYTGVDIAKDFKERNVRTKKGVLIDVKKIYKMIGNTKYVGKVQHGDTIYTNIYPAIIDEITWQKVQNMRQSYRHSDIRKQDSYEYILSGKTFCGYCKERLVGVSGRKNKHTKIYRYYHCLTQRRKKDNICHLKSRNKESFEDEVMDITWKVLSNNNNLKTIAKEIVRYNIENQGANARQKALEIEREQLLKATENLIKAVEMGIVTEQTKIRLKQLETDIAQCDIAIEIEKQKDMAFVTEDMIMDYFKKIICGDITNNKVRKQIIKTFIREIVVYNDVIVILYNFVSPRFVEGEIPDDISEFDLVKLRKFLVDEKEVNKEMDITIFYTKEYFAVVEKRNENRYLI